MRQKVVERVNRCIDALNEIAGFGSWQGHPEEELSPAHVAVVHNLWGAHLDVRPDEEIPAAREAFKMRRGECSPGAYGLPTHLASYQKDRLSMPSELIKAAELSQLVPECDRSQVVNFEQECLRPIAEVQALREELGDITPYFDPLLRASWRKYSEFLHSLHRVGMVRWSLSRKERVTPFFVKKKNGKIRLIIDARRVNRICRPPPKC